MKKISIKMNRKTFITCIMRVIEQSGFISSLLPTDVEQLPVLYIYSFKFGLVVAWHKIQELWDQKIPE